MDCCENHELEIIKEYEQCRKIRTGAFVGFYLDGMTENKPPYLKICVATSKEKQPPRNLTKPQRRFYVYLTTEE